MSIASDVIWMDGKFIPFDQANVHVLSHTLHYGLGAFEGIRAYEQADGRAGIWRLDACTELIFQRQLGHSRWRSVPHEAVC